MTEILKFNPAEASFSRAKQKIETDDDAKKQEQLNSLAEKSQQNINDLVVELGLKKDQERFVSLAAQVEDLENSNPSSSSVKALKEELVVRLMELKAQADEKVRSFRKLKRSADHSSKFESFAKFAQQEENKEIIRAKIEEDFHGGLDRRLIRAYEDLFLQVEEWESKHPSSEGPKPGKTSEEQSSKQDRKKPESEEDQEKQLGFNEKQFQKYLELEKKRCLSEHGSADLAEISALARMIIEKNPQLDQNSVAGRFPVGNPNGDFVFGHEEGIDVVLPPGFRIVERVSAADGSKKVREIIAGPYRFRYGFFTQDDQANWRAVDEESMRMELEPEEDDFFLTLTLTEKVTFLENRLIELENNKPSDTESAKKYFKAFEQAMESWKLLSRRFESSLKKMKFADEREEVNLERRYNRLEGQYRKIATKILSGKEVGLLDPSIAELVEIVEEYGGKGKAEKQKLYTKKERLEKIVQEEFIDKLDPLDSSKLIEILENLTSRSKKLAKPEGHTSLEIQLQQTNSMKDYMEVWFFDDKVADNTRMSAGAEYFAENKKYELSEYDRLKIEPAIEVISDEGLKKAVKFLRDTTKKSISEILSECRGKDSDGCPVAADIVEIIKEQRDEELKGEPDAYKKQAIMDKHGEIIAKISAQESNIGDAIRLVYQEQKQLQHLLDVEKARADADSFMEVMNNMIATGVFHVHCVPEHGRGISSDIEYDAQGNPEVKRTRVLASEFAGGNTLGESAYKKFIRLGLINSCNEYFDSETQRAYRDKSNAHEDQKQANGEQYYAGALQELISIIFTEYLSNTNEKKYNGIGFYRSDEKKKTKSDVKKLDDDMMDLIEMVSGSNIEDLKAKPEEFAQKVAIAEAENPRDEEKIAHLKDLQRRYDRIAGELGNHTETMFTAFKFAMKFKIAADNLTTKATYNIAAATDSSMPPAIEMLSSGRYADGIRKMSKQSGSVSGYLDEFVTLFNNDKILQEIPPSEAYVKYLISQNKLVVDGAPVTAADIPSDPEERKKYLRKHLPEGSLHDPKFNIMPDVFRKREYVDFPQYQDNDLRSFYRTTLQSIHDAGAPDDSFVMNSDITAVTWFNTETAIQDLDKAVLVGSGGKDWWDFLMAGSADPTGEKTWAGLQDKINTNVSILEGMAGTGSWLKKKWQAENGDREWTEKEQLEYCLKWKEKFQNGDWENDSELKAIPPHRRRLIALTCASMSRVFETCTKFILGRPEQTRVKGGSQEITDRQFNTRIEAVFTNLGEISGKALDGNYYAPLLKKYLGAGADDTLPGEEKKMILSDRSDKFRLNIQRFSTLGGDKYTDYKKRSYELREYLKENNFLPWLTESSSVGVASLFDQGLYGGISDAKKNVIDRSSLPQLHLPYTAKSMFSAQ